MIVNKWEFAVGNFQEFRRVFSFSSPPPTDKGFIDFLAPVFLLSFLTCLCLFKFYFVEYSYRDTMRRIRLSTLKCVVICFGIAVLVLIARRNFLWDNSPSTKQWSTFYQELALPLSHPQSTLIFNNSIINSRFLSTANNLIVLE